MKPQLLCTSEIPSIGNKTPPVNPQMLYTQPQFLTLGKNVMVSSSDASWGLRVRELRSRRHLSRLKMEDDTGVAADTINRIERGDVRKPRGDKRRVIAEFFGVSEGYLMTGKPHEEGDPEYDILQDPLWAGSVEIKPKAPFQRAVTLSESVDDEEKARQVMEIAQTASDKIKRLVFGGDMDMQDAIQMYGFIYAAVKEGSEL